MKNKTIQAAIMQPEDVSYSHTHTLSHTYTFALTHTLFNIQNPLSPTADNRVTKPVTNQ